MILLCVLLMIVCYYDYGFRRIPNFLVAGIALSGIGWSAVTGGPPGMLACAGHILFLSALTYPLFRIGALGAGDVKLLGACAGFLPFAKILSFLFVSLLIAAIISVLKLMACRSFGERFSYFAGYVGRLLRTGCVMPYMENEAERVRAGICLAGPVFAGILLYLGGAY